MPDRINQDKGNSLYSKWRATTEQINQLPKAEHGGYANPTKRDELVEKRNNLLKKMPEGTFPTL